MKHSSMGLPVLTALMLVGTGVTVLAQDAPPAGGQPPAAGGARQGGGRQGGRGGQFGGGVTLSSLSVDSIDSGLTLTADQKTKIKAILAQKDTDTKALPALPAFTPGQQPDPADQQARQDGMQKRREISTKADTDIQALLTDEQKTKWTAYQRDLGAMQQAGLPAGVLSDLKLTADQKTKILAQAKTNQQEMQDKMQAAQQSGQRMSREDQMAMRKDATDKVSAILTPTQRAMLEKYNRDHPQAAFGGFGGGRRQNGPGAAGAPGA